MGAAGCSTDAFIEDDGCTVLINMINAQADASSGLRDNILLRASEQVATAACSDRTRDARTAGDMRVFRLQ